MIIQSARVLWLGAILVVLCFALTIIILWGGGPLPTGGNGGDSGLVPYAPPGGESQPGGEALDAQLESRLPASELDGAEAIVQKIGRPGPVFAGRVVERDTGEPVRAFYMLLRRDAGGVAVGESVEDRSGRFSFALEHAGAHELIVWSPRHARKTIRDLDVPGGGLPDFVVEVDRGFAIAGLVVEDATGRPVSDAMVVSGYDVASVPLRSEAARHRPHTFSDTAGRFLLRGLQGDRQTIVAVHSDFAEGFADIAPEAPGSDIVIRLPAGLCVFGKALSDNLEPIGGLVIELSGNDSAMPMIRTTETAPDGSYRTAPAMPGGVSVSAEPPAGETETSFGFTAETRSAELIDEDVQVDFGPAPDQVVWRGRLIDPTGLSVEGVAIGLLFVKPFVDQPVTRQSWRMKCDHQGRFQFVKLHPGRYRISVTFPDQSLFDWKEMTFQEPGMVDKDLILECGVVRGEIIDERTGTRVLNGSCHASLHRIVPGHGSCSTSVGEDGTFCIRGVAPGTYAVRGYGKDLPNMRGADLTVAAGQVVEGVRIGIPAFGRLKVQPLGFGEDEELSGHFVRHVKPYTITSAWTHGDRAAAICILPGAWQATFELMNVGRIRRDFLVIPDQTTELVVRREELEPSDRVLAVAGSIIYSDGMPVANAVLTLGYSGVASRPDEVKDIRCTADENGCFRAEGLRPGDWMVWLSIAGHRQERLADLPIPKDAPDPLSWKWVVHRGRVTGRVYPDPQVAEMLESCWIYYSVLLDGEGPERFSRSAAISPLNNEDGRAFSLPLLPSGTYTLSASATGHKSQAVAPFSITDGQTIDLGTIILEPDAFVLLEVVDTVENPVAHWNATFPDIGSLAVRGIPLSPSNKQLFLNEILPDGPVRVRIEAVGFKEAETTLTKAPGKRQLVKVVLERT